MADDSWKMTLERLELSDAGAQEVLKSGQVQGILRRYATGIAQRAGGDSDALTDFAVVVHVGGSRARAVVYTATYEGRQLEASRRALTSAL